MKTAHSIILMLLFPLVCKAQNDWERISDSIAMVSRAKADKVLINFDTFQSPKLLYSLEDKYFYMIIKDKLGYKEYYISIGSIGESDKIRSVKAEPKTKKQRKQQEQYRKLLSEAEPIFDLSKYHANLITRVAGAKIVMGKPSYFVVKDIYNKRYGEYSLSALTVPIPINIKLWSYLVRKLSDEIAKDVKE